MTREERNRLFIDRLNSLEIHLKAYHFSSDNIDNINIIRLSTNKIEEFEEKNIRKEINTATAEKEIKELKNTICSELNSIKSQYDTDIIVIDYIKELENIIRNSSNTQKFTARTFL